MSNYAADASRKHQSSNIFFTQGNSNPTPATTRHANSSLTSNVFKPDEPIAPVNNRGITHHNKSDIFGTSAANESFQKQSRIPKSNVSDIFFENSENEPFKKDNTKSNHNPDQYYRHETAFFRKLKELNPEEKFEAKIMKPCGLLSNEHNSDNRARMNIISDPKISAKERKLLMNITTLNPDALKSLKITHPDQKFEDKSFKSDNALESKAVEMKSNIFNDPGKEEVNKKYKPIRKQFEKENGRVIEQPRPKPSSNNWNANIDWKDSKNEILFQNNDIPNQSSSAFERKINDLQGNIGDSNKGNKSVPVPNPIDNNRDEKQQRHAIKNTIEAQSGKDQNRMRKNLELSSIGQGSDFYQENAKFNKAQDRDVKAYEINDIDNFTTHNVNEIESEFRRKGMHIYDVKTKGSCIGVTKGAVSFKVRGGEEDTNFQLVKNQLKEKLKLNIEPAKPKIPNKNKDVVPTTTMYDIHPSHDTKKDDKSKAEKTSPKAPKFSKSFNPANTSYKNHNALKGFTLV